MNSTPCQPVRPKITRTELPFLLPPKHSQRTLRVAHSPLQCLCVSVGVHCGDYGSRGCPSPSHLGKGGPAPSFTGRGTLVGKKYL